MNTFHTLALACICMFIPSLVLTQSYSQIDKELKPLDGANYIRKAVDGAEQLVRIREFADAKKLLDKAVKKSKSKSKTTHAVILMEKASLMSSGFPLDKKYIKEIVETVNESLKKLNTKQHLQDGRSILNRLKYLASSKLKVDDKLLEIDVRLKRIEDESLKLKGEQLAKNMAIESKADAALEIQKLRVERVRLEGVTEQLAVSVELNEQQLSKRKAIINKMSREKTANEAVLQYNKRIIDSLKFSAQIDSIAILHNQQLIAQQKTSLELAQTELKVKDAEIQLNNSRQQLYFTLAILGLLVGGFLVFITIISRRTNKKLQEKQKEIEFEKERAEDLLLNILPEFIALELKEKSRVETRFIDHCTVMFTDFINFSSISKQLSPKELIDTLDECFREFDKISSEFNIEKIKTIGDSYMCASGVPVANNTHALNAVKAAQKMIDFLEVWNDEREKNNKVRFDARIGIHSGPVIAGVVGLKKFAYDIWGDTVNIAARIESQSSAQRINISSSTYNLVKDHFQFENRGKVAVKNMKEIKMYYLEPRLSQISEAS